MKLPYTEAESEAAYRDWKAMCGHHSIAAATGLSLEAIRKCGIKLCGWMNPRMISQCLSFLGARYSLLYLPKFPHPCEALAAPNYHPARIMRVQFHGPWMAGPPAAQYRNTHYIACLEDSIMDPLLDTNVTMHFEMWIELACKAYPDLHKSCTGFSFTHAWNIAARG